MAAGACFSRWKVIQASEFVPSAVKYVFYVALPCLVINGLGINIDIYDEEFLWKYINAFLILRAIALVFSFLVAAQSQESKKIGQVAVLWLALTWSKSNLSFSYFVPRSSLHFL